MLWGAVDGAGGYRVEVRCCGGAVYGAGGYKVEVR